MVKFIISKPVSVVMVFIALSMLGIVGLLRIPITPLPDINIPEISVHVSKKNTSAAELESTVVQRLRTQLHQVPDMEDLHSETRDGYAILHLRFNYGTDINYAFIWVNEKIDLFMNSLPADMERPRVVKASATDIPVSYINISVADTLNEIYGTDRFIELSEFAGQVIKRRLEQLPEVAFVDVTGTAGAEVCIVPDSTAMSTLNIQVEDFKRIIESNNLLYGNVLATDGILQYNIRFATENLINVEDIRNISFKYHDRIFKLKDIARVNLRHENDRGCFIANNKAAVCLAVIKQPDSRMDDLRSNISTLLTGFEKDYPGIRFEQVKDQTALLDYSISSMKQDLFMGCFLAFILLLFFMRNWRSPALIGITIPVCFILSILFFSFFHITINIISLSGLVLSAGLMIDNTIIVIDNVTQYRQRGMPLQAACVQGTTDLIRPLLSSALTTCSVFLPLIFLSGISGALFYDQAVAIAIGLGVSLMVSISLLPTLYYLFHRGTVNLIKNDFFEKYGIGFFEKMYEAGYHWVFRHKMLSLLIIITLVICNFFLFTSLKKEQLPSFKQTELVTDIDWNRNISIDENKRRMMQLVKELGPLVIQSDCMIGQQGYLMNKEKELSVSEAQLYVKVEHSNELNKVSEKIKGYCLKNYPGARLSVTPPKNIFEKLFGSNEPPILIHLKAINKDVLPDIGEVRAVARQLSHAFSGAFVIAPATQQTLTIKADAGKLLLYDLSIHSLYDRLKSRLGETMVGSLQNGQYRTPIMVVDQANYLEQVLGNTNVLNSKGVAIPITGFLKVSKEETYKTIQSDKNGNYVPLAVESKVPEQLIDYVNENINGKKGMETAVTGSYFSNNLLIREMAVVLVVAVLLLYFILAAQFESLIQPLIVLVELPISMSGALIMLYAFGSSINLMSLIGLIFMCGIIINDSILKIDTINQLRKREGLPLMEAIHTAGKRRLKSIIMTALTTILSVAPFLFGSDMGSVLQKPLSLTLMGGMLIGTPISLYFIPLVYWFYYRKRYK